MYYLRTTVSLTFLTYYTRLPFLIKKFQRWTGKFSLYPHVMVALVFLAFTLSSILNLRLRKRVVINWSIQSSINQTSWYIRCTSYEKHKIIINGDFTHDKIKEHSQHARPTSVSGTIQNHLSLARDIGTSGWLNVLPLEDEGYVLNKDEFRDTTYLFQTF